MSRTVTVNVTQRDIDKGEKCSATSCPIARAAKRVLRQYVEVDIDEIWASDIGHHVDLPLTAQKFIRRFDAGNRVQPIRFSMEIPS